MTVGAAVILRSEATKNPKPLRAKLRCLGMRPLWILHCVQNDSRWGSW